MTLPSCRNEVFGRFSSLKITLFVEDPVNIISYPVYYYLIVTYPLEFSTNIHQTLSFISFKYFDE